MKKFRADLHVHTVLSPCAEIEMLPPLIVSEAKVRGINLIAITDHNASANISAVQKAALGSGITVLPGMELQTKEEVHVLCLFDTIDQIIQFQNIVDQKLPSIKNRPDYFGEQLVVDDKGDFVRNEERLLITSTALSINEAYSLVDELGGIFIPAHVNRKANGLLEILGFMPDDIPFLAVEISRHISPKHAKEEYPQLNTFEIIQNGDVHRLSDFIGTTIFEIENPSIREIKLALRKEANRSYNVNSIN
ncbi:MAG: histidinol-phosphatase [Chloroflexi bacterium HGW-Chloroflexi-3]|nr:MAG: histidinol-phosphatase [Chloroflexi bacterium HGW-Chloroflexi-3]